MSEQNCNLSLSNTKGASCPFLMDVAKKMIIVPEYTSAGAKTSFATTASLAWATIEPLLNEGTAKQNRMYPLEIVENVEDTRAESSFFSFQSGRKSKTRDGVRSVVMYIPFQGPEYLEKLKSWGSQRFGVHIVDKQGNYVYITDKATKLKVLPILVDNESWDVTLIKKTETDPIMIRIAFDFRDTQKDELLRYVDADDLDFDALEDTYGLYDVEAVVTGISQTGFTLTLTTDYGKPVTGLVVGDFYSTRGGTASRVWNVTDGAAVTLSSVTESSTVPGQYALAFTSQTVADVIRITPVKNRFDFTEVIATTVTIAA